MMMRSSVLSHPTKWPCHPPSNRPSTKTTAQVLPKCAFPALIRLLLEVPVLPSLRRLGRWLHMPSLPCHRPHGIPPLQLSHTSNGSGPGDMWVTPIQVAQFLAGLPQFVNLPPLQINFESFPPSPSFPPSALYPLWPSVGPLHLHIHFFLICSCPIELSFPNLLQLGNALGSSFTTTCLDGSIVSLEPTAKLLNKQ